MISEPFALRRAQAESVSKSHVDGREERRAERVSRR
jgi:hypothetical protein